jgi:DNA-binding MarR family transcriptional regulator
MSSPRESRAQLLTAFGRAHRRLVAEMVMFNQTVAERLGLNVTELQCVNFIDIVGADGKLTAGQLAELAGISTGAMTRLIDRLERAGYVRRERPPEDRRRVVVHIVPERGKEIGRLYGSFRISWEEAMADYSDDQIAFLLRHSERAGKLLTAHMRRLLAEAEQGRSAAGKDAVQKPPRKRAR